MSPITEVSGKGARSAASVGQVDLKLEVVCIPVSDVDRAKEFYGERLGWRLDADFLKGGRAIQFTPPGSPCSVHFGSHLTSAAPGSAQGMMLVVPDIQAARDDLVARGVEVSEVFHWTGFDRLSKGVRLSGPAPDHQTYGSYLSFDDPDGNGWLVQEVTTRLPGRAVGETTYASASDLEQALRRAAAAHGEHEKRTGEPDADWPVWYAEYMVREQRGEELPL
jgi:catechol 2,3-dioxygenase-like lactoylglutathione lyase family enzyme